MRSSVIIPTWQRPGPLRRCLEALRNQSEAPGEILVVVRPEDAQSRSVAEEASAQGAPVRVIDTNGAGVVDALRTGRREASGELIAFTDDDAAPDREWLARMSEHLERDPAIGAVGGRDQLQGNQDPPLPSAAIGRVRWYGRRVGEHHRGAGPAAQVDALKGVNVAFRRAALDGIDFDPRLRGGGAQRHWEMAICLAVKHAGWEVLYDPSITVDHREGERFGPNQRGFRDHAALRDAAHNEMYAMLRWLPWWRKPLVLGYGLLVGSREAPGVVTAVERGLRDGGWRTVLGRFWAATRGRLQAVGTAVGALRS